MEEAQEGRRQRWYGLWHICLDFCIGLIHTKDVSDVKIGAFAAFEVGTCAKKDLPNVAGAEGGTRTPTALRPLAPQASASASSATSAPLA